MPWSFPLQFYSQTKAARARALVTCPRSHRMCTSLPSWDTCSYLSPRVSSWPEVKPSQGTLSLTWCLKGFSHLGTVVLRTQDKTRLLSSLTDACSDGSTSTKIPTQSRRSCPLPGCPGELPVPGDVGVGTSQHRMDSWPWWPFKESHPPHGSQATLTLRSSNLSPPSDQAQTPGLSLWTQSSSCLISGDAGGGGGSWTFLFISSLGPTRKGRSYVLSKYFAHIVAFGSLQQGRTSGDVTQSWFADPQAEVRKSKQAAESHTAT